jgi:GNAT superfamily N-acetyltransferase
MIVLPPGKGVGNPFTLLQSGLAGLLRKVGLTCVKRMLGEFEGAAKNSRKRGLAKGEVPYYVFFIGTRADRQSRGLGGALMEEVCERAGREGRSVWIEATSEGSARLFRRMGFVDVEEVVLGKGKVGEAGYGQVGGPGVTMWTMVWRKGGSEGSVDEVVTLNELEMNDD